MSSDLLDTNTTMNPVTPIINKEAIKTLCQGALGAMTFGMYHMYVTKDMLKRQENEHKLELQRQDREHKREIQELQEHVKALERRRWFW